MFEWFKKSKVEKLPKLEKLSTILSQRPEKKNLSSALKIAISALEKDIFEYNWSKAASCNCGVVVQALCGIGKNQVDTLYGEGAEEIYWGKDEKTHTWRQLAQKSCTVTGEPMTQVFRMLASHGFTPEDVVHLEYMKNSAILQVSGIDTKAKDFYSKKSNLILYLKAWLKILEQKEMPTLSEKEELEANLLIATCNEDYKEAARLRDQISTM